MSASGELAPQAIAGPPLVPARRRWRRRSGGRVIDDLVSRLRPYVAPPPPSELGWQAAAGAGLILLASGLSAALPSGEEIAAWKFLRWVGRDSLASTIDPAGALALPFALLAAAVLLGIGLIYWRQFGAPPALVFLTAQCWIGVAVLFVVGLAWLYVLVVLLVNLLIWIFVVIAVAILSVLALIMLGGILAAMAGGS
jgi:hypothetical protein